MTSIPCYPEFIPMTFETADSISKTLKVQTDGLSEFTFGHLYFFRYYYQYKVSTFSNGSIIVTGKDKTTRFFFIPIGTVPPEIIKELFKTYSDWKFISELYIIKNKELFEHLGCSIEEDRDNFDYVYMQKSLSTLAGKKLHKKKNHVNGFLQSYPDFSVKPLNALTIADARSVLEHWAAEQQNVVETDYNAAQEALLHIMETDMFGSVLYVQNEPIAWCLAELTVGNTTAVVHFEKARSDFRGVYQYINYAFAQSLPETVLYINREQDLGDEGLRHAKMSYRPEKFIKKYRLTQGVTVKE